VRDRLRVAIVGCGRAGTSIAALVENSEKLELSAIFGRSLERVKRAADKIGTTRIFSELSKLPDADIFLIAIDDKEVEEFAKSFSRERPLNDKVVAHLSGSLTSEVFSDLKGSGASIGSCHPLKSFTSELISMSEFRGTLCVLEGDEIACQKLDILFQNLEAETARIKPEDKLKYHSAAVFASNYLVTALDVARELLEEIGLDKHFGSFENLSLQVLQNVFTLGPDKALTGPVDRGETEVISKELNALSSNKDIARLYGLLAMRTSDIALRKGQISSQKKDEFSKLIGRFR